MEVGQKFVVEGNWWWFGIGWIERCYKSIQRLIGCQFVGWLVASSTVVNSIILYFITIMWVGQCIISEVACRGMRPFLNSKAGVSLFAI